MHLMYLFHFKDEMFLSLTKKADAQHSLNNFNQSFSYPFNDILLHESELLKGKREGDNDQWGALLRAPDNSLIWKSLKEW